MIAAAIALFIVAIPPPHWPATAEMYAVEHAIETVTEPATDPRIWTPTPTAERHP